MRLLILVMLAICWSSQAEAVVFVAAIPAAAAAAASTAAAASAAAAATAAALSTAATVATIGSAVVSAAGTVFSSLQARKQAKVQAAQAELNAKLEGTAGLQRDTIRREELARTLGSIRAARGDRGLLSPTATAFTSEADRFINSDRTVELLNSRQRQADLRQQARQSRARGRASLVTGAVSAAGSLFQAANAVS